MDQKIKFPSWITILLLGIYGIVTSLPIFIGVVLLITGILISWFFLPVLLVLFPVFIPFQPALNPSSDIDLASGRVLIVLFAIVGFTYFYFKKTDWFNLSTPTIIILFFLFWNTFSFLFAQDISVYLRKILVYLSIFPIYFLLLGFLKKFSQWRKAFFYWTWTCGAISLIGLGQFLFQFIGGKERFFQFWSKFVAPILIGSNAGEAVASNPSWFVGTGSGDWLRAISTFPDPHMLAYYLGLSIPIQIVFAIEKKKKIYWALPLLSLLVLLLTFSRGSYVGLAGSIVWLLLYNREYIWERRKYFVGAFAVAFIMLSFLNPVRERFSSILDLGEGSNLGRLKIWNEAVEVIEYNPIFGVGLGNYSAFVRPESKYREPIYAHNTYLDIGSEIGLPGAFAWILLIIWSIIPLFRRSKSDPNEIWNIAISVSILWFALHCFFETPIFSPQILPLVLYLIAFKAWLSGARDQVTG